MPRFVHGAEVWHIAQAGKQLQIGSTGAKPQATTTRTFQTAEQAQSALQKLVAEKLAAGYRPASADPRNPELEAQIAAAADPYDPALRDVFAVYADWLEREGDPRGPLIALELNPLAAAYAKQFAAHADYFLGDLAQLDGAGDDAPFAWQYGFIRKIYLAAGRHAPLDAVLARVLAHPSARFAADLSLGGNDRIAEALAVLVAARPPALRALRLWNLWQQDLGALWPALPALRRIALAGQKLALGDLRVPACVRFELIDSEISHASARALSRAPWPVLRDLKLDFSTGYVTGDASIDDVFALLARSDLPALTRLALNHTRYIRELVRELAASPLAAQLERLDLANNYLTDAHARELAAARGRFPKLQLLDVSANHMTPAGVAALAELAPKVNAARQIGPVV